MLALWAVQEGFTGVGDAACGAVGAGGFEGADEEDGGFMFHMFTALSSYFGFVTTRWQPSSMYVGSQLDLDHPLEPLGGTTNIGQRAHCAEAEHYRPQLMRNSIHLQS